MWMADPEISPALLTVTIFSTAVATEISAGEVGITSLSFVIQPA